MEDKNILIEKRNELQQELNAIHKKLSDIEKATIAEKLSKFYGCWLMFINYDSAESSIIYIKDIRYYNGSFGFNGIHIKMLAEEDAKYITLYKDNNSVYDLKFGDCVYSENFYKCNSDINSLISFLETGRQIDETTVADRIKSGVEYYIKQFK